MGDTPWQGDACSLVDEFRAGRRSPAEELQATFSAIDDSKLNAFCYLARDEAEVAARAADINKPFGGIPIGVKTLDPMQENSYLALADLFDQLERYREAAELLERGRARLPDSTAILLPLGTDLIRAERYAAGIAVIREIIQRAPDVDEAYIRLADAAHRMGDAAQELRTLQQLAQRRPNYPMIDVLIARAMLAQEKIDYNAVLRQLAAAERKSPGDPEIFALRGRAYVATEQYKAAVDPLRRSIELRPLDAATYYQLARVYQKLGRADLAREQFERVKHLETKTP